MREVCSGFGEAGRWVGIILSWLVADPVNIDQQGFWLLEEGRTCGYGGGGGRFLVGFACHDLDTVVPGSLWRERSQEFCEVAGRLSSFVV